jgi:hypothetical protein
MTHFIQDTDNMTLCIPRVFSNIGEKRIRSVFYALKLGHIGRIDIVSKISERGEKFNRVFIHFERWFDTTNALSALKLLSEGNDIKVIYDDPWFWKVSTYRKQARVTRTPIANNPSKPNPPIIISISGKEELSYPVAKYDSSVPILDYKSAPFPKRTKLVPKKHKLSIIVPIELEDGEPTDAELEDGEIVE